MGKKVEVRHMKKSLSEGPACKFRWRYILAAIVLSVIYVIAGTVLSYVRQPGVSQEYKDMFDPKDCYSDEVSCDRACVIEDNEQALEERLRMIGQAKERIILSTFDFHADKSGKDMIAALMDAAKRGVDVKILVDGFSALQQMDGNAYFYALSTTRNVEIRVYNRINLLMPWKSMGRLHDKYVIADEGLYLLGGRNTYDYFLGDSGYRNYDRDVLVYSRSPQDKRSSIHQLEDYFESVWNLDECRAFHASPGAVSSGKVSEAGKELEQRYRDMLRKYPVIDERADYEGMTYEVNKITLLSNPVHVYSKEPRVFYSLTELMKDTEEDISIHTPYIICNDWMYKSLKSVCAGSGKAALMTNSVANNGNPFGASDYKINKEKLLETGITVYEYEGGVSYHGKSVTIGDDISIIGSFNMDMRSTSLDKELMVVFDSEDVNSQLKGYMREYEAESVRVLDADAYDIPEGVTRQEISSKREFRVKVLTPFNWLRFLM